MYQYPCSEKHLMQHKSQKGKPSQNNLHFVRMLRTRMVNTSMSLNAIEPVIFPVTDVTGSMKPQGRLWLSGIAGVMAKCPAYCLERTLITVGARTLAHRTIAHRTIAHRTLAHRDVSIEMRLMC